MLAFGGKTWQKSQTVAYIKTLKGTELQSQQKKMQDREKTLKTAKKADLWAKRELRFTAGSQGHAKETSAGKNYPEYPTQRIKLKQIDGPVHRHTNTHTH